MYKQSQLVLSLLLNSISTEALSLPPSDGKFFYMGMDHEVDTSSFDFGEYKNLYHANIFVGSTQKHLELWVSTTEHQIGLFQHDCGNCDLNGGWDPKSSTSGGRTEVNNPVIEKTFIYNNNNEGKSLTPNTFVGLLAEDDIRIVDPSLKEDFTFDHADKYG